MVYASFAIVGQFFGKVFFIFNKLLPTLIKTLYTNVVQFPASISSTSRVVQGNFKKLPQQIRAFCLTET
jgi:hypothetical protein